MDHAETVAKRLFESLLPGAGMEYHPEQSRGEHDFDLHYPDGRVCPVEVTSSVDRILEETHAASSVTKKMLSHDGLDPKPLG